MKYIYAIITFGIMPTFLIAQNAFYEAQFLAKTDSNYVVQMLNVVDESKFKMLTFSKAEEDQIRNLSAFYGAPFSDSIETIDFGIIRNALKKYNEYLEAREELAIKGPPTSGFAPTKAVSGGVSVFTSILSGKSAISDSTQSNIIDGIAKYYAEEFKKAQTITYLKAFESTAGKIGELQILFPNAYEKLKRADPSKFPDLGKEYKKIFYEDLKSAWSNLVQYFENHPNNDIDDSKLKILKKCNVSNIREHNLYFPVLLGNDLMKKLSDNQHPVDILNYLDLKYYNNNSLNEIDVNDRQEEAKQIKRSIVLALHGINLLQSNLRDTATTIENKFSNVWINIEQLRELNTLNEIKYFFGLIYQQDKEYFKWLFDDLKEKLDNNDQITEKEIENILAKFLHERINPLLSILRTIQESGKGLTSNNDPEAFLKYLESNLDLFTQLDLTNKIEDLSRQMKVVEKLVPIYQEIRNGDFSNTVYYIVGILIELLEDKDQFQETLFKLQEYGGFMSEIITAENSDDVKETIKKFVAPPASYILKRTYTRTVSITGQPGYFLSQEWTGDEDNTISGLTLPLGVELTFKKNSDFKNTRGSIGIFAQILDLGAVLNFRISNSESTLPDQITFEQVLSPGISINYGFKNSPLTLGIGYQRTPELREVDVSGTKEFAKGDRFFMRVAWDIPFINIARSKSR